MDWLDLMIKVKTEDTQIATAIISMVCSGMYIEDYSQLEQEAMEIAHIDLIDEELLNKDRTKSIIHIYIDPQSNPTEYKEYIEAQLRESNIHYEMDFKNVREIDWANAWKQYYHPISLSEKIAICPSWEDYSPKKGQKVITLDPGMAFGTGTHETTRLCLSLLEQYMKEGATVLDVGTGSGILAICAKLLGCGKAVGVDIDKLAVKTAIENAKINNCHIEFIYGNLADDIKESFNIICANIVADAIIMLSKDIPKLLDSEGIYIVSGIIDTRKNEVLDELSKLCLQVLSIKEEGGWVAIAFKKKGK